MARSERREGEEKSWKEKNEGKKEGKNRCEM